MTAMTPNPEPPVVIRSSAGPAIVLQRSGAKPLTGCDASQKKPKVCLCTASSNSSSGNAARSGGLKDLVLCMLGTHVKCSPSQSPAAKRPATPGESVSLRWNHSPGAAPAKRIDAHRCVQYE